jgi:hypothetical protein
MVEKLSIEDLAACEDTLAVTYEPIDDAPDTIPCPPWWEDMEIGWAASNDPEVLGAFAYRPMLELYLEMYPQPLPKAEALYSQLYPQPLPASAGDCEDDLPY